MDKDKLVEQHEREENEAAVDELRKELEALKQRIADEAALRSHAQPK